mmetsp:Transcript_19555/g.43475  ORF Transcript_19555/g.43475 Transcript_19555/m.43475 type:complete len:218 (-) Transcript_19555:220-873(-)
MHPFGEFQSVPVEFEHPVVQCVRTFIDVQPPRDAHRRVQSLDSRPGPCSTPTTLVWPATRSEMWEVATPPSTPTRVLTPATHAARRGPAPDGDEHDEEAVVIVKNIPNKFRQRDVQIFVESVGFEPSQVVSVFVPMDFLSGMCKGYAFVRFSAHEVAGRAVAALSGHGFAHTNSTKVTEAAFAKVQASRPAVEDAGDAKKKKKRRGTRGARTLRTCP